MGHECAKAREEGDLGLEVLRDAGISRLEYAWTLPQKEYKEVTRPHDRRELQPCSIQQVDSKINLMDTGRN